MIALALLFGARIEGNHAIATAQLEAISAVDLDHVIDAIVALYWDFGFADVTVAWFDNNVDTVIQIHEGAQYQFGRLALRGFTPGAERYLTLRPGSLFLRRWMADQQIDLYPLHPFGSVTPLLVVDPKRRVVDVTFEWRPR